VFAYDLAVSAGGGVWGPEAAPVGQVRVVSVPIPSMPCLITHTRTHTYTHTHTHTTGILC
jgi:hypothetical protein